MSWPDRRPPVSFFVGAGLFLGFVPEGALTPLLSADWEISLARWLGAVLVLYGLALRSMLRRRLPPGGMLRVYEILGPVGAAAGLVTDHRVFLVVGFSLLVAATCRAGAVIGLDVQVTTLRRLQS